MASASPRRRVAVVLFNLGGPDSPKAVRPFLFNLFRDPAIIGLPGPARLAVAGLISGLRAKAARANYAIMGGSSPLLRETLEQGRVLELALSTRLADAEVKTFTAMRYWRPTTEQAARDVAAFDPDEIVLLPLYPQYSTTTTGSSAAEWARVYRGRGTVRTVCCYPDNDDFIEAHARRIEATWESAGRPEGLKLLFSAHGLPQKVIAAGDPYQWQVERTCKAVVDRLGPGWDWRICYQSRVGPLKWLGPSTPEAIHEAAEGGQGVIISPITFVSDHIETLVELDHEYAKLADEMNCMIYLRVPALGVQPNFIAALSAVTARALERTPATESGCGGRICPAEFGKCPVKEPRSKEPRP